MPVETGIDDEDFDEDDDEDDDGDVEEGDNEDEVEDCDEFAEDELTELSDEGSAAGMLDDCTDCIELSPVFDEFSPFDDTGVLEVTGKTEE